MVGGDFLLHVAIYCSEIFCENISIVNLFLIEEFGGPPEKT